MDSTIRKSDNHYTKYAKHWALNQDYIYLNHGAFGACPIPVLKKQSELRLELERQPIQFMIRVLPELLENARNQLADFVGADHEDLFFVPCATHGVNTILRSLTFKEGDELLTTDHEYFACKNALDFIAKRSHAKVVVARIPFPLDSKQTVIERIISKVSKKTRIVLIDHVTSPTGLILPLEEILKELERFDVDVIIDGAHAPGMFPLKIKNLGVAYYTGNCHKWICSPKGSAFLYVRHDKQSQIHPLSISHIKIKSSNDPHSQFQTEFYWNGTYDPSAYLCVPEAINFMKSLFKHGWLDIMWNNCIMTIKTRRMMCEILGVPEPSPDSMIGSLASIPIPDSKAKPLVNKNDIEVLQDKLFNKYKIEVPVCFWPKPPKRLIRVAVQIYNSTEQYKILAYTLKKLFSKE
jgi:isopenicillin-N epimerase